MNITTDTENDERVKRALECNVKLQLIFNKLKNKLEYMLEKCRDKYDRNEEIISIWNKQCKTTKSLRLSYTGENKLLQLRTFYSCGAPYFKDWIFFPAPPNSDYTLRKKQNEYFAFDFMTTVQQNWTLQDKTSLIQGVKDQILLFLFKTTKSSSVTINGKNNDIQSDNLKRLIQRVKNSDFKIDWYRISNENLNGRHAENTCETMWNMYLRPDLNHKQWTENEDKLLLQLVKKYNYQDWTKISQEMKNRSEYQCFVRFRAELSSRLKHGVKWTEEEDNLLIKAVEKYRVDKVIRWNKVVSQFPHRTKKQIYTRYKYSIDPNIKKQTKFTVEEDNEIMAAVKKYGVNFSRIPISICPGRTAVQIRNRYFNVLRNNAIRKPWTVEDDTKLLNLVKRFGKSWYKIAEHFQHHCRISCRTRYSVISKYLEKHPKAQPKDFPRKKKQPLTVYDRKKMNGEFTYKKENYEDKLRSIERNYFQYFKYAYNFRFGESRSCDLKRNGNYKMLIRLLKLNMNIEKLEGKESLFIKRELDAIKLIDLKEIKNFICILRPLSINWCSLMGLRAVFLNNFDLIKNNERPLTLVSKTENEDLVEISKKRFTNRFFTIFYKTALLVKVKTTVKLKRENAVEYDLLKNIQMNT